MLDSLRALVLTKNFAVHGLPATVTRPAPDDVPIATRVIWLTTETTGQPASGDFRRQDPRRIAVLMKAEVPTVPLATRIEAAERPGIPVGRWQVDGYVDMRADQHRVVVIPAP